MSVTTDPHCVAASPRELTGFCRLGMAALVVLAATVAVGCSDKPEPVGDASPTVPTWLKSLDPFDIDLAPFDPAWTVDYRAPMPELSERPFGADPACLAHTDALREIDRFREQESEGRVHRKFTTGFFGDGYYWLVAIRFRDPGSATRFVEMMTTALISDERTACDQVSTGQSATIVSVPMPPTRELPAGHSAAHTVTVSDQRGDLVLRNEEYVWASGDVAWIVRTSQPRRLYDEKLVLRFLEIVMEAELVTTD